VLFTWPIPCGRANVKGCPGKTGHEGLDAFVRSLGATQLFAVAEPLHHGTGLADLREPGGLSTRKRQYDRARRGSDAENEHP
jgi:hypothetical protein